LKPWGIEHLGNGARRLPSEAARQGSIKPTVRRLRCNMALT
jgi:hypothetical protein